MSENSSLQQLELEKQRLVEIQKQLKAINSLTDAQQKELDQTKKAIKLTDIRISQFKKKAEYQKLENKEFESFARKFRGLSSDVQKQLQGTSKGSALYLSIGKSISKEKVIQARFANIENERAEKILENSYERESLMRDITAEAESQAKATKKAEDDLRGISDIERQIKDLRSDIRFSNDVQKEQLISQLKLTEQLRLKEERLKTIKEEQQGLFDSLPESIKGAVGFAKKLGYALKSGAFPVILLSSVLLAAVSSFVSLQEAASDFRKETGLTLSQTRAIDTQVNSIVMKYSSLGVEAKDVYDSVASLKSELGDFAELSEGTIASMVAMNKNFGIASETSAKVQGIFENVSGLSSQTAASVQMQAVEMARLAGVAPAKVMADIAESAEIASTMFKGDVLALTRAAIEARRLGTNLQSVASVAEKLLDFEGSIEEELVAATFVGGQFNLSKARALAYNNDLIGSQKEILYQLERTGKFSDQNYYTQQQLAKAAGMTVEEINKQLGTQERLARMDVKQKEAAEEAIKAGFDISNISEDQLETRLKEFKLQQQMQGDLEQVKNEFMGIVATVGSSLVPALRAISPILVSLAKLVGLIAKPFEYIGEVLTGITEPIGSFTSSMSDGVKEVLGMVTGIGLAGAGILFMVGKMGSILSIVKAITGYETIRAGYQKLSALFTAKENTELIKKQVLSEKQIAAGFGGKEAKDKLLGKKPTSMTEIPKDKSIGKKPTSMTETPKDKSIGKKSTSMTKAPKGLDTKSKGGGMFDSISKIKSQDLLRGAAAILIIAGALWVAAKAFQEFETVKWPAVLTGIGVLASLTVAALALGKVKSDIINSAFAIGILSASLYVSAKAFQEFKGIDWKAVGIGVVTLGLLALGAKSLAGASPLIMTGAGVIAVLGASLIPLGIALKLVSPFVSAFGEVITSAGGVIVSILGQLPPIITAVTDGFTNMLGSITPKSVLSIWALGPALISASVGMAAFTLAMTGASVASMFTGNILDTITKLGDLSVKLPIVNSELTNMKTVLSELGNYVNPIDMLATSINNLAGSMIKFSTVSTIGGIFGGLLGGSSLGELSNLVKTIPVGTNPGITAQVSQVTPVEKEVKVIERQTTVEPLVQTNRLKEETKPETVTTDQGLSIPLNVLVSEIKMLRQDMANGKIAVYMDTEKVTSKISRQVDVGTRNFFNIGSL